MAFYVRESRVFVLVVKTHMVQCSYYSKYVGFQEGGIVEKIVFCFQEEYVVEK